MKQKIKIRNYHLSDKKRLMEIMRANIPQYFHGDEFGEFSVYLDHDKEDYFVCEFEGNIIACGGLNYEPDTGTAVISWDMVDPLSHGEGIGRKLTEFRIHFVKVKTNYKHIIVRTSQHTNRFYEKLGFKLKSITKDYWAKGYDLYFMELHL